jgi:flagellar basal-body rod protein FlgB
MPLDDIPLFGMLRSRLGYLSERQRLIAQNVANADTPGYRPQDLRPFTLQMAQAAQTAGASAGVELARTSTRHIAGAPSARPSGYPTVQRADSETTMNGNGVVLEEQMMHMAEARIEYDAAIGFYQKSLNMLRLAARRPGG